MIRLKLADILLNWFIQPNALDFEYARCFDTFYLWKFCFCVVSIVEILTRCGNFVDMLLVLFLSSLTVSHTNLCGAFIIQCMLISLPTFQQSIFFALGDALHFVKQAYGIALFDYSLAFYPLYADFTLHT